MLVRLTARIGSSLEHARLAVQTYKEECQMRKEIVLIFNTPQGNLKKHVKLEKGVTVHYLLRSLGLSGYVLYDQRGRIFDSSTVLNGLLKNEQRVYATPRYSELSWSEY